MLVCPVNSALVSFGQETPEQKSFAIPLAIGGGIAGGLTAKLKQLKVNPEDVDSFIKTVDDKLPLSGENRTSFFMFKEYVNKIKDTAAKKLQEFGLQKDAKEIQVNDLLNKVVQNTSKTMNGLNDDIKYVQGEADYLKTQADKAIEYANKLKIIKEKQGIKTLIENSTNGKITTSKLLDLYGFSIKNNPQIKSQIESISGLVNKYNKQKMVYYPIIGLIIGSVIGCFLKASKNETKKA